MPIQNRTEYNKSMKAPEYAEYVSLGKERVKFVQSQTQG